MHIYGINKYHIVSHSVLSSTVFNSCHISLGSLTLIILCINVELELDADPCDELHVRNSGFDTRTNLCNRIGHIFVVARPGVGVNLPSIFHFFGQNFLS